MFLHQPGKPGARAMPNGPNGPGAEGLITAGPSEPKPGEIKDEGDVEPLAAPGLTNPRPWWTAGPPIDSGTLPSRAAAFFKPSLPSPGIIPGDSANKFGARMTLFDEEFSVLGLRSKTPPGGLSTVRGVSSLGRVCWNGPRPIAPGNGSPPGPGMFLWSAGQSAKDNLGGILPLSLRCWRTLSLMVFRARIQIYKKKKHNSYFIDSFLISSHSTRMFFFFFCQIFSLFSNSQVHAILYSTYVHFQPFPSNILQSTPRATTLLQSAIFFI